MNDDNIVDFTPRNVAQPGSLIPLCQRFLRQLANLGYAASTLKSYQTDLEQFVGFAASRDVTVINTIGFNLVDDWVTALVEGNGVSHRTAARKLECLRSFIKFYRLRNVIKHDPTAGIKVRFVRQRVVAPSKAQLMQVIDVIPTDTLLGKRDRALFRLMFDSALRVGGVVSLDVYNKKKPPKHCVTPAGVVAYQAKGGKQKVSVVDDATLALLNEWLTVRFQLDFKFCDALFVSKQGKRLGRASIAARLKHYGKLAGLPHVHCHLFRHRRLGEVYEKTGDLRVAADMAGHENMNTFADIYGLQSAEARRHQIRTLAPLDDATETLGGAA